MYEIIKSRGHDPRDVAYEVRRTSLKEELEAELAKNESEANRLTELLSLLKKNPEIERILELLGRR